MSGALGTGLDVKNAKADDVDLLTGNQTLGDGLEGGGNDSLGVLLGEAGLFSDGGNKLVLIYWYFS